MKDGEVVHLCSESCIANNNALLVKCYGIRSTYKSFLVRSAVVRNIGMMLPHLRSSIFFDLS